MKLKLELARRIAAFIKLRHGCVLEAWETSSTTFTALDSEYVRECSRNTKLQTELTGVEEELADMQQACSEEYVRSSDLQVYIKSSCVHFIPTE